jgi:hypothetical protein
MNKTIAGAYRLRLLLVCLLLGIFFLFSGCATPVGVHQLDPKRVQRKLTTNILTTGKLSASSEQILNRFGVASEFKRKPEKVIRAKIGPTILLQPSMPTDFCSLKNLP